MRKQEIEVKAQQHLSGLGVQSSSSPRHRGVCAPSGVTFLPLPAENTQRGEPEIKPDTEQCGVFWEQLEKGKCGMVPRISGLELYQASCCHLRGALQQGIAHPTGLQETQHSIAIIFSYNTKPLVVGFFVFFF